MGKVKRAEMRYRRSTGDKNRHVDFATQEADPA